MTPKKKWDELAEWVDTCIADLENTKKEDRQYLNYILLSAVFGNVKRKMEELNLCNKIKLDI